MERRLSALLAAVAAVAASALVAASVASANAVACTLVSAAQVRSILGLDQSQVMRNYDPTVAISEAVHTECGAVAWSGATPTSFQASMQTAKSGHGALVGIETWAPHDGSPNVGNWLNDDYDKLTGGFDIRAVTFPGLLSAAGWPAHSFTPPHLGKQTKGFQVSVQGVGKGLVAAAACWWEDKSSSAVCILDEEAAFRPVVKHLKALAAIAVPRFLG